MFMALYDVRRMERSLTSLIIKDVTELVLTIKSNDDEGKRTINKRNQEKSY